MLPLQSNKKQFNIAASLVRFPLNVRWILVKTALNPITCTLLMPIQTPLSCTMMVTYERDDEFRKRKETK